MSSGDIICTLTYKAFDLAYMDTRTDYALLSYVLPMVKNILHHSTALMSISK